MYDPPVRGVEEEITKRGEVDDCKLWPDIERFAHGEVVPSPMFPEAVTTKSVVVEVWVEEAITKRVLL